MILACALVPATPRGHTQGGASQPRGRRGGLRGSIRCRELEGDAVEACRADLLLYEEAELVRLLTPPPTPFQPGAGPSTRSSLGTRAASATESLLLPGLTAAWAAPFGKSAAESLLFHALVSEADHAVHSDISATSLRALGGDLEGPQFVQNIVEVLAAAEVNVEHATEPAVQIESVVAEPYVGTELIEGTVQVPLFLSVGGAVVDEICEVASEIVVEPFVWGIDALRSLVAAAAARQVPSEAPAEQEPSSSTCRRSGRGLESLQATAAAPPSARRAKSVGALDWKVLRDRSAIIRASAHAGC